MIKQLWYDESGIIISTELVLLVSVILLVLIGGLVTVRDAIVLKQTELSTAILSINPSYEWTGLRYHNQLGSHAWTAGSVYLSTQENISEVMFDPQD